MYSKATHVLYVPFELLMCHALTKTFNSYFDDEVVRILSIKHTCLCETILFMKGGGILIVTVLSALLNKAMKKIK